MSDNAEDLEKRLAEVRRQRDAFDAERADAEHITKLSDQLEQETRALEDARATADAEAKHGRVGKRLAYVDTRLGRVIVKAATASTVRMFLDTHPEAADIKVDDARDFARPQIVYPERDRFDAISEELPLVVVQLAVKLIELAGSRSEAAKGKS